MRTSILLFLIFAPEVFSKGARGGRAARGGNSKGFGGGGKPKSRATNPSSYTNNGEGFNSNHYRTTSAYYLIWATSFHRRSYLHEDIKPTEEDNNTFDCGNGKKIPEDKVCNWIDDCGNGMDERTPLPCEGEPSPQEIRLIIIGVVLFLVWLIILVGLINQNRIFQNTSTGEWSEELEDRWAQYIAMIFFPALLLFVNIIFIAVLMTTDKSLIIDYLITHAVFSAIGFLFALCIMDVINIIVWAALFILTMTVIYHGSMEFAYVPDNLLQEIDLHGKVHHNLTVPNQFWFENESNKTHEFIIRFNNTEDIGMIWLSPTYPNHTTEYFKLSYSLNCQNWTTMVNGPMPNKITNSLLEIYFDEETFSASCIKYQGFPKANCNQSEETCVTGLDRIQLFREKDNK